MYWNLACRPYEREVIFSIARHYKTNETLPEELYQKIAATRNYRYDRKSPLTCMSFPKWNEVISSEA